MRVPLWVDSETGPLRSVIIGYADNFVWPKPINKKHRRYGQNGDVPTPETLRPEFERLHGVLTSHGVTVHHPVPVPGVPDQLTPRDIGFVVDDTFVIASMRPECRREEYRGILPILEKVPSERIMRVPPEIFIEGGDVIVDHGILYVGISERTTHEGVAFLRDRFGDRIEVVPVELDSHHHEKDVLHLDCAFVPVGREHALIYPEGIHDIPEPMRELYQWIEVQHEEQMELATNVLSLSQTTVISRPSATRLNDALRDAGLNVIEVSFRETPKSGGSFRCASLPLSREPTNVLSAP
jgi:N-dimethylarginine dimethylaminohydrolase